MESILDQVKITTEERDGRWYWGYWLLGKMYWCGDLGLQTEEQARDEARHELRRHLQELARGGPLDTTGQASATLH